MLDEKGYKRNTYDEIKTNVTKSAQDRFGADINTSENSAIGILIRFITSIYNEIEQKQEDSYNSAFVNSASGVSLDRLAANFGVNRKPDTYAQVDIAFTGKPNYIVKANTSYKSSDDLMFTLSSDVALDNQGKGVGLAYSVETGSKYNVAAGIGMTQVQPVGDLYSAVTNSQGTGGSEKETDTELRNRITYAAKGVNSATYNGLVSAVRSVSGVNMVRIIENNKNATDSYGNPPYTIHVYVSGGDTDTVASAIFNSMAIGINTYGSITVAVYDNAGNKHNILFDRPAAKDIYGKILLNVNDNFPTDGVNQVKSQIRNYISSLEMGKTVRFSYLYKYIYDNVDGIEYADVKIGTKEDNGIYQAKDVVVSPFEVPTYNPDTITVEVTHD